MDTILEYLKTIGMGAGITILVSFILGMVKKHRFEEYGVKVGVWLSKLGRIRLGKSIWEKLEDAISLVFLSFAKGLKIGLDLDDAIEESPADEIKAEEIKKEF